MKLRIQQYFAFYSKSFKAYEQCKKVVLISTLNYNQDLTDPYCCMTKKEQILQIRRMCFEKLVSGRLTLEDNITTSTFPG